MANFTIRRELCGLVIRIGRFVIVVEMTPDARVRRISIACRMTAVTVIGNRLMGSNQRVDCVMVKDSRDPRGLIMTNLTIVRKLRCLVVRVGCFIVVIGMTSDSRVRCVDIPCGMTLETIVGNRLVSAMERVHCAVIKRGWHPGLQVVALGTGLREIRGSMIGIRRRGIVLQVTTHTFRRRIRIILRQVAAFTILDIMPKGERKKIVVRQIGIPAC